MSTGIPELAMVFYFAKEAAIILTLLCAAGCLVAWLIRRGA